MDELDDIISEFRNVSRTLHERGWCEGTNGNLSILINGLYAAPEPIGPVFETPLFIPQLEKRYIIISRSASRIQDIPMEPEENLGLYRIEMGGRWLSLLWGAGAPSSEWLSHLLIYARNRNRINAVIHSHMEGLYELGKVLMDPAQDLPEWIGWVPKIKYGTLDLARATVQEIGERELMVWHDHGILSMSSGLEGALRNLIRFDEWARSMM
ncbi:MAG: class II aldolase/adducin family protein [Thermoplasmatota archaeon]